jgi:hypothetical protein
VSCCKLSLARAALANLCCRQQPTPTGSSWPSGSWWPQAETLWCEGDRATAPAVASTQGSRARRALPAAGGGWAAGGSSAGSPRPATAARCAGCGS